MQFTDYFIIDFDSTFTKVEALDILGEISLANHPEKVTRLQQIKDITDLGMEGKISFRESLIRRVEILDAHKNHLPILVEKLKSLVSDSFVRNKAFITQYADQIYILSNGFKDFIVPVVAGYGIKSQNVFANDFRYDQSGKIIGFDENNILSANQGKPKQIEQLQLPGKIHVLGDGFTDYEIKKAGFANKFYAFTENVKRSAVVAEADQEAPSLDEVLYQHNMQRALSYPKSRIKVLMLENIHDHGIQLMKKEGYIVEVHTGGMDEDELCTAIEDVSILCIRSKTNVTAKVLNHAKRLHAIGAFCIGTNQIDLKECAKKGIAVFNAPYSNTRSVVELAIGEIIMLIRNIPDKSARMHLGQWDKSAKNSFEIRGKSLGIIGYGNIGSQLSVLAEALGMKVFFYDITEKLALGNATKCHSLDELLEIADFVSLHVDGRPENKNLISTHQFNKMKDGVIFLNLSRGHVVDIDALKTAIKNGKVIGTGVDVYPYEPKTNDEAFESELRGLPNTILTPHIGGSTLEAQKNIADFVPNRIMDYINTGSTSGSVNLPNISLPTLTNAHRFIHMHRNEPGVLAEINRILADKKINIAGQYLKTDETLGYVITDIDKSYDDAVIKELKKIEATIRFRVLY